MESVKDLIVDVNSTEVSIALMENHRLIELNKESSQGHSFSVGDVHLGKVKKILPALNAAFVDIGDALNAFLPLEKELNLRCGDMLIVQGVAKQATETRFFCIAEITFAWLNSAILSMQAKRSFKRSSAASPY